MNLAVKEYGPRGANFAPIADATRRVSVLNDDGEEMLEVELNLDGSVTLRGIRSARGRFGGMLRITPHVSNQISVEVAD